MVVNVGERERIVCPRCDNPGRLVEKRTPHNTYIYVVHGRRMCYVGAQVYSYVTRLHDFELKGAHDDRRYLEYLDTVLDVLVERARDRGGRDRDSVIESLARALLRIVKLLRELSAESSAAARALERAREELSK
ncbi:MAG: hypothetical protein QW517_09575 [Thermofilaceae archaeon]